jgi:signal transduction histidine kinase
MTLRRSLLLTSVLMAAIVAALGTVLIEWLRANDRAIQLERASASAINEHTKEGCEAHPNWFLAGPRDARPTQEQLAQPDADVYAQRPDTKPRPFEFFAFDEEFRGVSTAAPRFPDAFRIALKSGNDVVTHAWKGPEGTGVESARWTHWRSSECAIFLFRAAPPPHQMWQRAGIFTGLFAALFLLSFGVSLPIERRAAGVAAAMRQSARSEYSGVAPATGQDEITSIGAIFNEAAADIRLRSTEIKEQQDALRRIRVELAADLVAPLAAVPARVGDVLRSVSVTPVVREQMQAALRDAHTLEHRGANLVAAMELRDREAAFDASPVDLTALVKQVVAGEVMFASACGVPISATVPAQPVMIAGDARFLELALLNLIDNAIRYNKPGGTVTVDLDSPSPGHFVLLVSDDGVGVNDASLKYFNGVRRFRGDERRKHRTDEVGLGLAIVHEVTGRARIGLAFRLRDNGGLEVKLSA